MIRNESEYRDAVERLKAERERLDQYEKQLRTENRLSLEEVRRVMEPLASFHFQLEEEVEAYDRLKRGQFDELHNFEGIGRLLVGLRIAMGLTQRDLAERLDVHESQVSRDERNDYHGITVERANRILIAMGVTLKTSVEPTKPVLEPVGA